MRKYVVHVQVSYQEMILTPDTSTQAVALMQNILDTLDVERSEKVKVWLEIEGDKEEEEDDF